MAPIVFQPHQDPLLATRTEIDVYDNSQNDIIGIAELKKEGLLDEFVSRYIYTDDPGVALFYGKSMTVPLEGKVKKALKIIIASWEVDPTLVQTDYGFDEGDISRFKEWVENGLTEAASMSDGEKPLLTKSDYKKYAGSKNRPIRLLHLEAEEKVDEFIGRFLLTKRYDEPTTDRHYDGHFDKALMFKIREYLLILIGDDVEQKEALMERLGFVEADINIHIFDLWLDTDFLLNASYVYAGFETGMSNSVSHYEETDPDGEPEYRQDIDQSSAYSQLFAQWKGQWAIGKEGVLSTRLDLEGIPVAYLRKYEDIIPSETGEDPEWQTERSSEAEFGGKVAIGRMDGRFGVELEGEASIAQNDMPNGEIRGYDVGAEVSADELLPGASFEVSYERDEQAYNPPETDGYYQAESMDQEFEVDAEVANDEGFEIGADYRYRDDSNQAYYKAKDTDEHRVSLDLSIPLTKDTEEVEKRDHTLELSLIGRRRTYNYFRIDKDAGFDQIRRSLGLYAGLYLDLHDDASLTLASYGQMKNATGSMEYTLPYVEGEFSFDYYPGKFSLGVEFLVGTQWGDITYNDLSYLGIDQEELVLLPSTTRSVNMEGSFSMSYTPRDFLSFSLSGYGGYNSAKEYSDSSSYYVGGNTSFGARLSQKRHADWLYFWASYQHSQGEGLDHTQTANESLNDSFSVGLGYSRRMF